MPFSHRHYVPTLLTKLGERQALQDITPAVRARLTPLLSVAPIAWDWDISAPSKTIDQHLAQLPSNLATALSGSPAFIDLEPAFIDETARMADGSHPLAWMLKEARTAGAALIPVVTPSRDADYLAAARSSATDGLCLRLRTSEWPTALGTPALDGFLSSLGAAPESTDLILDAAEEVAAAPSVALTALRNEMLALPHAGRWRTVTVSGAGFPKDLTGISKGVTPVDRIDWLTYLQLIATPGLPVTPRFGDYGVAHPDPTLDVDPRLVSISASLRYTADDVWLVAKGNLFKGAAGKGQGGAAMAPVVSAIAAHPQFAGAAHCAGDQWVDDRATGLQSGGGNMTVWRRVATAHHLTHVTEAVAILP